MKAAVVWNLHSVAERSQSHRPREPESPWRLEIPEAAVVGFLGRADDSPYIETSNAVEWSTQEIWDIPYLYAIGAIA